MVAAMAEETGSSLSEKPLRTLMRIINQFRGIDAELSVQQQAVLIWVALNEDKTQRDLIASLDIPAATVSRHIAYMSDVNRLGKQGLGLVVQVESPLDRRAKLLRLTPKGRTAVRNIIEAL